jgi:molybdopterin-guanine dinucleotide biosynthesis adapter protein
MMEEFRLKAIGIIGYKNSGKTTLLTKLANELNTRGYTVSSIKHTSEGIDINNKDTYQHKQFTKQTAIIAPSESAIFFPEGKTLEYMISLLEADFVLIEGLKKERTYPKIICLKSGDNLESLVDGLEVCVYGMELNQSPETSVPFFNSDKDIGEIADIIERSAFKLPNLDCGGCGYNTCYEIFLEIIKKSKTPEDCVAMNSDIKIEIDGQIVPLNPFVSKLLVNTIKAMMSSLKNYHNGAIDIHLGSDK